MMISALTARFSWLERCKFGELLSANSGVYEGYLSTTSNSSAV